MYIEGNSEFTTGRKKIFCYEDSINADNVVQVVQTALVVHNKNVQEIERLFTLYLGFDELVVGRERKGLNQDINNIAFVPYYSLIADYKTNLFLQNPLVLINADGEDYVNDGLRNYGKIHRDINKYARDKTTSYHVDICGVGYRFIEQDKHTVIKDSVISPESAFTIYGDDNDDNYMARVYITDVLSDKNEDIAMIGNITQERNAQNYLMDKRYTVYTDDWIYEFIIGSNGDISDVSTVPAMEWGCPIIEYKKNPFRIGSFERVISLIQLLSILRSDGVNGVVQSVAGLLFGKNIGLPIINAEDTDEEVKEKEKIIAEFRFALKEFRQLIVNDSKEGSQASLEYIAMELYNADIEILYQGILDDIVTLTRIPNSVVNLGGSGNSGAAETASGTKQAMEDAKNAEPYWFESVREQTRKELEIAHYQEKLLELTSGDIEFALQRMIVDNPNVSAGAYATLIGSGVPYGEAALLAGLTADAVSWENKAIKWEYETEERRMEFLEKELEITGSNQDVETDVYIGEEE